MTITPNSHNDSINPKIVCRRDLQLDTGTIIAVAAALIFYLRLIILQRHKESGADCSSKTKPEKTQTQASTG
jgi:hypothetical protein